MDQIKKINYAELFETLPKDGVYVMWNVKKRGREIYKMESIEQFVSFYISEHSLDKMDGHYIKDSFIFDDDNYSVFGYYDNDHANMFYVDYDREELIFQDKELSVQFLNGVKKHIDKYYLYDVYQCE